MKKSCLLIISLIVLLVNSVSAKKVKFAVDLSNDTVNSLGVYVSGDFQVAAGYASDWCANCTPLLQEGSSGIYSVVIDIPAFQKYEYKFLNGDQFYNAEFVPIESRVGYDFNDNRWIYVDSLSNDTTFIGALVFAGNAPAGLKLLRLLVDMQGQSVASSGVHVAGDFQAWDPAKTILYSFGSGVYEVINYVSAGLHEYKFYNGNTLSASEIAPAACSSGGVRNILAPNDTVLEVVCFSACTTCTATGIEKRTMNNKAALYPNPAPGPSVLKFNDEAISHTIIIRDITGRTLRIYDNYSGAELVIEKENLVSGIYSVCIIDKENSASLKLVIE